MKKFLYAALALFSAALFFCGCSKKVDYLSYVSERRENIFQYCDDELEIKIYVSEKETPYSADGICGSLSPLVEIFVTLPKNYDEVEISVGNIGGEMSYRAVENLYYLSASDGKIDGENAEVNLTLGGESKAYTAQSVLYDGVMDCNGAVNCVIEHDNELFKALTQNNAFCGEIYVRLLYDDGCYYYVGVCDRNKKIIAYLVDGERGKIIATKELDG